MSATKLIVGNWKMNGLLSDSRARAQQLGSAVAALENAGFDMVLCPPATMIGAVADVLAGSSVQYGGQDCHTEINGAFTGNISAAMLKDLGCTHVIVGHSERLQSQGEVSALIAEKAAAAHAAGLVAIICVGETDEERSAGKADGVVAAQLAESLPLSATAENTAVAYEPVWAIGTGKTASTADIENMHAHIRAEVNARLLDGSAGLKLLYGGSVKAANAGEILHLKNVDGVLVGGASLVADDFIAIAKASASA